MYLEIPTCGIWYHVTCSICSWYHRYMENTNSCADFCIELSNVAGQQWPRWGGAEKHRRRWCRWRVVAWNLHPHSARGLCITELKTCSIPQVENTWALDAKGLFFRASSDPVALPVSLRINFTTCEVKRQACPRYHRRASQRRDNPTPVTQWADEMGAL